MRRLEIIVAAICVFLMLCICVVAIRAEDKKPSELSQTKLELSQAKLKLSYAALQGAQNEFQKTLADFNAQCELIVKETGKPAGTRCNPENLEFVAPPKAPEVKK
jgi:hypothetical protein